VTRGVQNSSLTAAPTLDTPLRTPLGVAIAEFCASHGGDQSLA
jgi:hypothetical protein